MYNTNQAELFLEALDAGDNACHDSLQYAEENASALQIEPVDDGLLIRAKFPDGSRLTAFVDDDGVGVFDFADSTW